MAHGFLYLVAIKDWASRWVLSWQLSNSLAADFCVEALSEAIEKHGCPSIIALNEIFPEATYGAIPVLDQYDALEAYLAFNDCALAQAPRILDAYVTCLQHCAIQVAREMQRPTRPDSSHRTEIFSSTI